MNVIRQPLRIVKGECLIPKSRWGQTNTMINIKIFFAIALLSASTTAIADEIVIDTQDLYTDISTELAKGIKKMHQDIHEDVDAVLIANKKLQQASNTEQTNSL